MKALITGANGHIGSNVVRACLSAGVTPVAMTRANADQRGLTGLDVERRTADLLDKDAVHAAMAGVDVVLHVGAVHRNFTADPKDMMGPAVDGTRHVLDGALAHGIKRVVHVSTGATVGFSPDPARPLTEETTLPAAHSAYVQAKLAAEKLALAAHKPGTLEVVVVNPSGVFGPLDYRLTPATRGLLGPLHGDPLFLHLCLTHVTDVARGIVLAAQKGVGGQRYLLAGAQQSPKQLQALYIKLAGVKPAAFTPPRFLLNFLAGRMEKKARATGEDAGITKASIDDVWGKHLAYDSTKARTQLGATFLPAEETLKDTLRWLLFVNAIKPGPAAKVRAALGGAAGPDPAWVM